MKVTFKYGIGSFRGTVDLGTYWATKNESASYMRKYVRPTITTHNTDMGSALSNLSKVWSEASDLYKADMKEYSNRHYELNADPANPFDRKLSSFSWFMKMMYNFADTNEGTVDLKSVTYGDLTSLFADVTTVASCVEAGFLPSAGDTSDLTATM